MRLASEFLKKLQSMIDQHGDCPVVSCLSGLNGDEPGYYSTEHNSAIISFEPRGAMDANGKVMDCFVI